MPDRIFLACTPRTGNVWIRSIIARTLNLPSLAYNNPGEVDWAALPERCLVAMHWRHSPAYEDFLRRQGFRTMVTARHPLDVLVSILHFAPETVAERWLEGECGHERGLRGVGPESHEFAEYCLGARAEALLDVSTGWRPTADAAVRYEDVMLSPADAIGRTIKALKLDAVTDINDAVEASSLAQMRAASPRHVWRGATGDWRRLMTADLAGRIHKRHQRHFETFDYACDPDPDLEAGTIRDNWGQMNGTRDSDATGAGASGAPLDVESLKRQVAGITWFHSIDLGHGIVTPGHDMDSRAKIAFNGIPQDLTGKTVLDIGAWDGLFSFEAEKRGAARVLAIDSFVWSGAGWGSKAGFELARRALGSRVEDMALDVMDLTPSLIGTFDVVFCLGVLYHLRHPLFALEKVASVTRERLILSTWADLAHLDRPAAAFYPKGELAGDVTNWWGINPPALRAMLADVGFKRVTIVTPDASALRNPSPYPLAIHAWK